jgi:hypothetical protein
MTTTPQPVSIGETNRSELDILPRLAGLVEYPRRGSRLGWNHTGRCHVCGRLDRLHDDESLRRGVECVS